MLIAVLHRRGIRLPRWVGVTLLVVSALALFSGFALAQPASAYGVVYLLGNDTLGVERVTRAPGTMRGVMVLRGQPRVEWTATLGPAGRPTALTLVVFQSASADAAVLQRAALTLTGTAVKAEITVAGATTPQNLTTRADALMLVNSSLAMIELIVDQALATAAPTDSVPVFLAGGGQTVPAIVTTGVEPATVSLGPLSAQFTLREKTVTEIRIPSQNLRGVRVEGAAYTALKMGGPDYSAPAGAPYRAEHVTVAGPGGHRLAATLTVPTAATGRVAAAITISGSGGQDRDEYIPIVPGFRPFRQIADTLGRRGIAVLRFDDRGIGESTGDHAAATSEDFANDVRALVAWLRTRSEIDPERIFLIGHSEGGLIAPMVAAADPRLAGIVLLAGTAERGDVILRFQLRNLTSQDPALSSTQRDSALRAVDPQIATLKANNPWMRFFLEYDPVPTARRVKVPTLIVQGETDQQVLPHQAAMLDKAMREGGNRDVTVQMLPARNHLFLDDTNGSPANYGKLVSGRVGPGVLGPVADWIATHATATPPRGRTP